MFTGIVKKTGKVKRIIRSGRGYKLEIKADTSVINLDIGGSVAVNGVCLSIVKKDRNVLVFDVVKNTYNNTNLKRLKPGDTVNLEGALRAGDDISGHIVSGHVDAERKVLKNRKSSAGWILDIEKKYEDSPMVARKGSISVDGVSLTIAEVGSAYIRIFIIPHTLEHTTLSVRKTGDLVNIEFDMIAKYSKNDSCTISREYLTNRGFI
jgi:riboflavin synthase